MITDHKRKEEVTSLAEVWIETSSSGVKTSPSKSLPLRKCGLKLYSPIRTTTGQGHFPCGSVDWNRKANAVIPFEYRHFPCGSVDWNNDIRDAHKYDFKSLPLRKCGLKLFSGRQNVDKFSHFPCGSVDWNNWNVYGQNTGRVTSLAEVWIETAESKISLLTNTVTSLAEVWIETGYVDYLDANYQSLPLRKCGLKQWYQRCT